MFDSCNVSQAAGAPNSDHKVASLMPTLGGKIFNVNVPTIAVVQLSRYKRMLTTVKLSTLGLVFELDYGTFCH